MSTDSQLSLEPQAGLHIPHPADIIILSSSRRGELHQASAAASGFHSHECGVPGTAGCGAASGCPWTLGASWRPVYGSLESTDSPPMAFEYTLAMEA